MRQPYRFSIEDAEFTYPEFEPLYRQHFDEMLERMHSLGIPMGPYDPWLEAYFDAARNGSLVTYVVRTEAGEAIGYSNIYITRDAHNSERIAQEDTIFIRRDHRGPISRVFVRFILDDLRRRGCKRGNVTTIIDPRVAHLWKRMGFKEVGTAMTFVFEDAN